MTRSRIALSVAAADAVTATTALAVARSQPPGPLPSTPTSAIQHLVVVMMENRSFDHDLGWHPNADAQDAGLSCLDADGVAHETHPLAPDLMDCGHQRPNHESEGARAVGGGGKVLPGFRVPTIVISPFSKGDPRVDSATCDRASILKLIEKRRGLRPLTPRDASADVGNLLDVLDFAKFEPSLPALPHAATPGDGTCLFTQAETDGDQPPATMPQQPIR